MAWLVLLFVVVTVLTTSLFKNVNWNPKQKNLLAVFISVIGAAITVIISKGGMDAIISTDLLESVVLVYGGSQAFYNFVLNGTSLEEKLANVGNKNQIVTPEPILYDKDLDNGV